MNRAYFPSPKTPPKSTKTPKNTKQSKTKDDKRNKPRVRNKQMSIRISDLHKAYKSATAAEAIQMADLGAMCYQAFKGGLYEKWTESMSADESEKAASYRDEGRREGRKSVLESLKEKLSSIDELTANIASAERTIQTLRGSIEKETARRVSESLESHRKDYELSKMSEMSELRGKISYLEGQQSLIHRIERDNDSLRNVSDTLRKELDSIKQTKSSHATGKVGEAVIWDMLNKHVMPKFQYSEVKNMTAVKHMADFHIWLMTPTGLRVKILLDSKKYKDPVPYSEIEKLFSDVDGDDEAQCGLMVSHDTAIYTRTQFQISRTPKGKLCLFMSFEGLDDGFRAEVLCWGLRVLANIVSSQTDEIRDTMIENIEQFMKEVGGTLIEMENCNKACKTLYESMKTSKENLLTRITSFKVACGQETAPKDHTELSIVSRCTARTVVGGQCSFRKCGTSEFCKKHGVASS